VCIELPADKEAIWLLGSGRSLYIGTFHGSTPKGKNRPKSYERASGVFHPFRPADHVQGQIGMVIRMVRFCPGATAFWGPQ
jgi:hypothetical protein